MQDTRLFQDDLQTLCNSQALFGLITAFMVQLCFDARTICVINVFGQCKVAKIIGLVFVHPLPVSLAYGMSVSLKI